PEVHRADEAVAPAAYRLDVARGLPRLTQSFARLRYTIGQGSVGHELLGPELCQQFLLGHCPVGMLNEVGHQIEDSRLKSYQPPVLAQLVARRVEGIVVAKGVEHTSAPGCLP